MEQEDYNEWVEDAHSGPAPSLGGDSEWIEDKPSQSSFNDRRVDRRGGGRGRGRNGQSRENDTGRSNFGGGSNEAWENNRLENSEWEANKSDNFGWDNSRSENGWEGKKSDGFGDSGFGERRGRGGRGGGRGRGGRGRRNDEHNDSGDGGWGSKFDSGTNEFSGRGGDNDGWGGNSGNGGGFGDESYGGRGRGQGRGRGGGRGRRNDDHSDSGGGGWSGNNDGFSDRGGDNDGWGGNSGNGGGFGEDSFGGRGRGQGRGRGGGRGRRNDDHSNSGGWGGENDEFSDRGGDNDGWEGNSGDRGGFGDDSFGRRGRGGRGRGRGGSRGGGHGDDDDFGGSSRNNGEKGGEENEKPKERYIPPEPTDDENVIFGSTISSGINFDKYDDIQIKVTGENVPQPINSFEDCQLRNLLMDNVIKSGYRKPTPVQKYALPIISAGRDLMACAQTGSGKTAAFLLPILNNLLENAPPANPGKPAQPQVVICSPTRELTIQIFNEARKFALGSTIKICIAYGGTVVFHQAQAIARGCNVLVATPGRLNDFISRNNVNFSQVSCFVLDEADRMLDMGFQPEIERMLQHESMPPSGQRQTLMFSATFPDEIQQLAGNYLKDYLFLAVGIVGGACADVTQMFYEVSKFDKRAKLVEILKDNSSSAQELTLVFVEEKRTADFIAAFLCENKFPATSIHGDRLQSQREEALGDFKAGRMPILVATAVAARGLDIKNVAHVVNYDMPKGIDEYVHRIGRTGRVGNRGRATSFFEPSTDGRIAEGLVKILEQTKQEVPAFLSSACSGGFGGGGGQFEFGDAGFGGEDVRGGGSSFLNNDFNTGARAIEAEEVW